MEARKVNPATTKEAIGERLRVLRHVLGKSQTDISAEIGIPVSRWHNYETGYRTLSVPIALALSDLYDVCIDWLYTGDLSVMKIHPRHQALLRKIEVLSDTIR